jgi:MinD superfamily P-loop ATPase
MMPGIQAYVQANCCSGCGICMENCPFEAIDIVDGKACVVGECVGCMQCIPACPEQAIVSTQIQPLMHKRLNQDPWTLAVHSGRHRHW